MTETKKPKNLKYYKYYWLAIFLFSSIILCLLEAIGLSLFFLLPPTEVNITLKANEVGLLLFGVFGRSTFTGFWLYYSWLQYRKAKQEEKKCHADVVVISKITN